MTEQPTFPLHTPDTAPEGSAATLAQVTAAWGFTPIMHATLAESPAALVGYEALWAQIAAASLCPIEQQVAYQAVNVFHGCGYCTMGHTFLSRQAEMEEADVAALRAGRAPHDPKLAALYRFTRRVVEARGDARGEIPAFLAAGFTPANVLDVVSIVATKVIANYAVSLTDMAAEEFMSDPALAWTPDMVTAAA